MNVPDDDRDLPLQGANLGVPVFNCVVYVRRDDQGWQARVANLDGLEARGNSERDALAQLIPAFKKRLQEHLAAQAAIPWLDPPAEKRHDEQQRLVPVHL